MAEEEPLVNFEKEDVAVCREVFIEEVKETSRITSPMIVVMVSEYLVHVSPMIMLGNLFQLSLSSASIATSVSSVTGYNVLFGMCSALETLCGQKYSSFREKTRALFSMNFFPTMGDFFRFAIPLVVMVCLEWWTFDQIILLSSVFPNPIL
ncbi:hypothetical protein EJD97_006811 [Solanum chilense]|uniref:Protein DETOXIFICATION n=1 Tax=Solanum chilense TaxID=4083 RepID=A0A6N2CHB5_SOLCI|nr:hypothetical protein EJD97_006811 [Solanum chilense]